MISTEDDDRLTLLFGALADPTRRAILARLTESDLSVTELAEPFAMSQPAISKHLKILESAGLISRSRVATTRYSHLEAEPLRAVIDYLEVYKRYWNSKFDRLDGALANFMASYGSTSDAPDTTTPTPHQGGTE